MIPDRVFYINGILTLKELPKATVYIKEARLIAAKELLANIEDVYALAEITGFSIGKCSELLDIVFDGDIP